MKKLFTILICLLLPLSLCSCVPLPSATGLARKGWKAVGEEAISPDKVAIMRYSSRIHLAGDVSDAPMYEEIPESGWVVLFHSYGAEQAFYDDFACFFTGDGTLAYTFDYEESDRLFEKFYSDYQMYRILSDGEMALRYISNCNFVSGMVNDADGDAPRIRVEKNRWYILSDLQMRLALR